MKHSNPEFILIVDDNPDNLSVLSTTLKGAGYAVRIAVDGEDALLQCDRAMPMLILLDVMMPGIDGFETCRRLKENAATMAIPVIFMTALADNDHKVLGLSTGVAHEINNPMGCIVNNLSFVQDYSNHLLEHIALYQQVSPSVNEQIEDHAEDIDLDYLKVDLSKMVQSMTVSSDRIRAISNSLRTFARRDTEHKSEFDLHTGLDSTLLILQHRLKAQDNRGAVEVVKAYGGLPAVLCYPGQLNQVFMNILANAVDAFDERLTLKPTITIFTEQRESNVLIRISDNAGGMPESVRAQIFKHAYTTKAVGKGTGLGLSIARQIMIEKHSGDLRCTSTLTKGTEFSIVLPVGAIAAQTF